MPTHIHLLVQEIVEGGISKYMHKLGGYSFYFNKQYERSDTLFKRYKVVPIKTDEQLHIAFTYVHTNPISLWEPKWKKNKVKSKEESIKKLENYFWTSYASYIGKSNKFLNSINREFFLNFFGGKKMQRDS